MKYILSFLIALFMLAPIHAVQLEQVAVNMQHVIEMPFIRSVNVQIPNPGGGSDSLWDEGTIQTRGISVASKANIREPVLVHTGLYLANLPEVGSSGLKPRPLDHYF